MNRRKNPEQWWDVFNQLAEISVQIVVASTLVSIIAIMAMAFKNLPR